MEIKERVNRLGQQIMDLIESSEDCNDGNVVINALTGVLGCCLLATDVPSRSLISVNIELLSILDLEENRLVQMSDDGVEQELAEDQPE